jgi:excisionase family DNA binding protein
VNDELFSNLSLLTLEQAAERLGISVGKVRRYVEDHVLIEVRIGGQKMIPEVSIVDGEPLHSLRGTMMMLIDCGLTVGASVQWLFTENDDLTEHGGTPMNALLAGHKSPVRRAAQFLAQ